MAAPSEWQFRHRFLSQAVVFATHRVVPTVQAELDRVGSRRPMVICRGSAAPVGRRIFDAVGVGLWWDEVIQHVPAQLVDRALAAAEAASVDAIVTIGGGSATGLGKDLVRTLQVRHIAVPTTYSGSEGTNIWGITRDAVKVTGRDDGVLPDVVVYDADLVAGLPRQLAVTSCLNAMAHSVAALSSASDPITDALAAESIRRLRHGLLPSPTSAAPLPEENLLLGAYLSGVVLASAGTGLHHKICHLLGGTFGMPHALTHAAVLPHVVALQGRDAKLAERLAAGFGTEAPSTVLERIVATLPERPNLASAGFRPEDVDRATGLLVSSGPDRQDGGATQTDLHHIIEGARTGVQPTL